MISSSPQTLEQWLQYFTTTHSKESDLGLDRIMVVAKRLNLLKFFCPIITVTGTNGKGSCVAVLESIYRAAGYNVGVLSSPFLLRFNEQVRINQQEIDDIELCAAFNVINQCRQDIPLTSFEFLTLAALKLFKQRNLDVIVLEVGMGGKRDAVNIVDTNLAVITNVAVEHVEWLGSDREIIGAEKAGIFREHAPAVCGEADPPNSVIEYAKKLKISLYCQNKDFYYESQENSFVWRCGNKKIDNLPLPKLALQNVAISLMAIELLHNLLPVRKEAMAHGIVNAKLAGRFQVVRDSVTKIFDVAHNPAGAKFLANNLAREIGRDRSVVRVVFSMLADKDIAQSIAPLIEMVDEWYIAPIAGKRAATLEQLTLAFEKVKVKNVYKFATIKDAYLSALAVSKNKEYLLVYGSFRTVAEVFETSTDFMCFAI